MIALALFWLAVFLIFYTYVGFTLLLIIRAIIVSKPYQSEEFFPTVSIIVAAYNEENNIENRIKNLLALDYPKERLQILIASDGSEDRTNEIVAAYENEVLKLLSFPRGGKDVTLNRTIPEATGDILVFTDANTIFAQDTLKIIVRPFADEKIGGVAGDQRYLKSGQDTVTGEHTYWSFDRILKEMESRAGNVISATGANYAIRRNLYVNVLEGVSDDFHISVQVIMQGYRLIFLPEALAFEQGSKSQGFEFERKVRLITRGFYGVIANIALLNPFKYGFYSLQFFTHKILRRLLYVPMIIVLLSNIPVIEYGLFYQITLILQVVFYCAALIGWLFERAGRSLPKIFALPTFLCMVYYASFLASLNILRGHRIGRWSTLREEVVA